MVDASEALERARRWNWRTWRPRCVSRVVESVFFLCEYKPHKSLVKSHETNIRVYGTQKTGVDSALHTFQELEGHIDERRVKDHPELSVSDAVALEHTVDQVQDLVQVAER